MHVALQKNSCIFSLRLLQSLSVMKLATSFQIFIILCSQDYQNGGFPTGYLSFLESGLWFHMSFVYKSVWDDLPSPLEHSLCLPILILIVTLILTSKVDFQGIFITMRFSHAPDLFLDINEAKIANVTKNVVAGSPKLVCQVIRYFVPFLPSVISPINWVVS